MGRRESWREGGRGAEGERGWARDGAPGAAARAHLLAGEGGVARGGGCQAVVCCGEGGGGPGRGGG